MPPIVAQTPPYVGENIGEDVLLEKQGQCE